VIWTKVIPYSYALQKENVRVIIHIGLMREQENGLKAVISKLGHLPYPFEMSLEELTSYYSKIDPSYAAAHSDINFFRKKTKTIPLICILAKLSSSATLCSRPPFSLN
jgi:hypothetical protein